ncbi:MAG: hypothetical protein ACTSQY_07305 [Candidatus Odinarchaeia archaeon]
MSKGGKPSKKVVEPIGFPLETKIKLILTIIFLIDGYRINRAVDFRKIDESIKKGTLGRPFAERWKNIRKVLWRIGTFPKNIPNVQKMTTVRVYSQIIGVALLLVASILMIVQALLSLPEYLIFIGVGIYVLATALIGLAILMRRKVAIKIAEYYYEDHERWKKEQAYLKGVTQQLIDALARQIKRLKVTGREKKLAKLDEAKTPKEYQKILEKYKIKLYNIDYTGIKVLSKPNFIRKHYVVLPKV